MTNMRILVGTLYCGENEYPECVRSIQQQSYTNYDHEVIENLPNREAHDTLYRGFLDRADQYDILIKVDADMVLTHHDFFARVVDEFTAQPNLMILAVAVWDFYSNQLISSLNCYRNTIVWNGPGELQTDNVGGSGERRMDWKALAPAATHCFNASPLQAFHYGIHRGIKAREAALLTSGSPLKAVKYVRRYIQLEDQLCNVTRLHHNFRRIGDRRLGLAALGAELAMAGHYTPRDLNYSSTTLADALESYHGLSRPELTRTINDLRKCTASWLPYRLRMEIMRKDAILFGARCILPGSIPRRSAKALRGAASRVTQLKTYYGIPRC